MISVKTLFAIFLIAAIVGGFSLASITNFGLAQSSTAGESSFKISGYILDSNGRGIAGAMIIFNVPQIVPAVYSDSSGRYVISAPAGTYHLNVWPPYDSNYIDYDEPGFVVGSDTTKNVTLYSGYKVSGYISDSSGTPVTGAVVLLNNFGSGWFSNYKGYYFLSVPAGTYTINAHPRTGYNYSSSTTNFPTYYEYNFTVNSNTIKNITVGGSSSTPSPTTPSMSSPNLPPSPTPPANATPAQITFSTDTSSSVEGSVVNVNRKLSSDTPYGGWVTVIAISIIVIVVWIGCFAVWRIKKNQKKICSA